MVRAGAEADNVAGPTDAVEGLLGARLIAKASSSSVSFRKRPKKRRKEENHIFIVIVIVVVVVVVCRRQSVRRADCLPGMWFHESWVG
jgi:hypothetical protein